MLFVLLNALISGLTMVSGNNYYTFHNEIMSNNIIGDYGSIGIETFTEDYSISDLYIEEVEFHADLRNVDRYQNFINMSVSYSNNVYFLNLSIPYQCNYVLSYSLGVGSNTTYAEENSITLYTHENGFSRTFEIPYDLRNDQFEIDLYFIPLSQNAVSQYDFGYNSGYSKGYSDGFSEGFSADSTAVTIFNGILNIALVPINFFLGMFNFEILGINISSFVSALLSVCLVIIVIRFITGKKQGD